MRRPAPAARSVAAGALAVTACTGLVACGTGSASLSATRPTGGGHGNAGGAPSGGAATTSPSSVTSTTGGTGAYGHVTAGPTCPVERPDQPCPPRAVAAEVDVRNGSGTTVASTRSDASGRYSVGLAPGSYTLVVVTASGGPRCPDTPVAVGAGTPTRADISCDTGIR